jgi:hypothetical protein
MTVMEGPKSAGLIARVQGILLRPTAEWDVIAGEPATIPGLFTGYACILAAIGPIVSILWGLLIASMPFMHLLGGLVRMSAAAIVIRGVLSYFEGLITVFAIGYVVDALAPSFDARKDPIQAMKLTVYACTGGWIGGLFLLIPLLGWIAAIGLALYSLYLFWLGLPKLMGVPDEKKAGYAIVVLLAAIVVGVVIGLVFMAIRGMFFVGSLLGGGLI